MQRPLHWFSTNPRRMELCEVQILTYFSIYVRGFVMFDFLSKSQLERLLDVDKTVDQQVLHYRMHDTARSSLKTTSQKLGFDSLEGVVSFDL